MDRAVMNWRLRRLAMKLEENKEFAEKCGIEIVEKEVKNEGESE